MNRSDLVIMCCPKCWGDLALTATKEQGEFVVEGRLRCAACNIDYPIKDRVPTMLPPGHKVEAGYGGTDDEWS